MDYYVGIGVCVGNCWYDYGFVWSYYFGFRNCCISGL